MKKTLIIATSLAAVLLSSCVKDSQEYKDLQAVNDSLEAVNASKDKEMANYLQALNEISDNFQAIAASESLINADAADENIKYDAAQRINKNLKLMAEALQKNRQKIAQLQQMAKKSGNQNKELQETIARLQQQLEARAFSMDSLADVLRQKDERIFQLDSAVTKLTEENIQKTALIAQQEDEMSSAYYVFGSNKELKAQRIITKEGVFKRSQILQKHFNKDYFVKVDIRTTTKIPLYSKKARILTSHPDKSYELKDENGNKTLYIKDYKQFWSISKYLVVRTD